MALAKRNAAWNKRAEIVRKPQAPWHHQGVSEVLASQRTDDHRGLSGEEAKRRLAAHGPNALPESERESHFLVFLRQFKSPLIYLLLAAAVLAFALGERSDAFVILAVVTLNSLIGAFQEGRAARSIEALRKLSAFKTKVRRDGQEREIDGQELVPGDVMLLAAGDAVAADARLIEEANLEVAEASLTGESVPVGKTTDPLPERTLLADRLNMIYAGTYVTAGRGVAVVTATGLETEVGKIAQMTSGAHEPKTPMEFRIERFGRILMGAAAGLFLVILGLGYWRGIAFENIFMIGVSQIVSMIPEGLPVAMTVALAVGIQRMAARKAIVRRLSAVETLGSTTVICTDKTGTLTRNEMTVKEVFLPEVGLLEVTGTGYFPEGEIRLITGKREAPDPREAIEPLIRAAVLCNDSGLQGPTADFGGWKAVGDPTEAALLVFAKKADLDPEEFRSRYPRKAEIPFDASIKWMATEHLFEGDRIVLIKGAPEAVLNLCQMVQAGSDVVPLSPYWRNELILAADGMAARALRVLAFAEIPAGRLEPGWENGKLKGQAKFLGIIGQMDPPRDEVYEAVSDCQVAGIRPIMVTGDHKRTGLAIGELLGIARPGDLALDGGELDRISDFELQERLPRISVFARVHPAQKLRIVEALQANRHVVAMTGDGVNDAPALSRADVGLAMGITGTDVAKEASKVIITDDNFATIVHAVAQGRLIFRNIKKLILYLFTTGLSEIVVLLTALVLGYPPPLVAVQILWINLVTDGALSVTLIMEPAEGDEMRHPPTRRNEPMITRSMLRRMAFMTPSVAVSTLGYFILGITSGRPFEEVRTGTFTVLAVSQWFNALNCRSEIRSVFQMSLFKNPWLIGGLVAGNLLQAAVIFVPQLNQVFHTVPLPWDEALRIGATASLVLWVEELRKLAIRIVGRQRGKAPETN